MTTICIIRHGQTDYNKNHLIQGRMNNPLNEIGIEQAHNVANILKEYDSNWDYIISSPLLRAIDTAKIIKDTLNFKDDIIINNDVIEREFGQAEGKDITSEIYDKIKKDEIIGMEKTLSLQHRCFAAIMKIANDYKNKKILIVSHSHFIKGFFTFIDKNITFTTTLPNTGLNYIIIDNNKIIKTAFNKKY